MRTCAGCSRHLLTTYALKAHFYLLSWLVSLHQNINYRTKSWRQAATSPPPPSPHPPHTPPPPKKKKKKKEKKKKKKKKKKRKKEKKKKKKNVDLRSAKIQISLRIRAVWSESSLGAFWIAKDAMFLYADNEDSDKTARMRRLIWVFAGHTCPMIRFFHITDHLMSIRRYFKIFSKEYLFSVSATG